MAPKTKGTSKKTGMIKWDEELAKQAMASAEMEAGVATGNKFGTRAGILTYNGSPIPNGHIACVIVGVRLANAHYPDKFDPENPMPPLCFAFGTDEANIAPHKQCVDAGTAQSDFCASCPHNVFGTADNGKGKACGNGRRLALISAGSLDRDGRFTAIEDPNHFKETEIGFMQLPPTALKAFAAYVRGLSSSLKRPPHGVFTKITVAPDPEKQVTFNFEALGEVPDEVMGEVMDRHKEAQEVIEYPYSPYPQGGKKAKPAPSAKAPAAKPAPRAASKPAPRAKAPAAKPSAKTAPAKGGFGGPAPAKGGFGGPAPAKGAARKASKY